jgi:hypothetical protein
MTGPVMTIVVDHHKAHTAGERESGLIESQRIDQVTSVYGALLRRTASLPSPYSVDRATTTATTTIRGDREQRLLIAFITDGHGGLWFTGRLNDETRYKHVPQLSRSVGDRRSNSSFAKILLLSVAPFKATLRQI